MIEMKVMGIALDVRTNSPIVVLHDLDNRKALPIWIGSAEASAIIRCIEGLVVARPMTHDLAANLIEQTGYKLDRIEINDVEKETYYATLFLVKGEETLEIDARPSDAIALAMRAQAPIFVTANVLMNGSVSTDSAKDEEEAQEIENELIRRYSEMVSTETDWINIVEQNLLDANVGVPPALPIIRFGYAIDFIVDLDAAISVGFDFEYLEGKRYSFSVNVTAGTVSSDVVVLQDVTVP